MATETTSTATTDAKQPEDQGALAEYLRGPQRKKRNYVILALGESFPTDLKNAIEGFIRAKFEKLTIHHLKQKKEFKRLQNRQIVATIFDDQIFPLEEELALIEILKRKKGRTPVPVFFLTTKPQQLIHSYNRVLSAYQEVDEFADYSKTPQHHILNRILSMLSQKHAGRQSRRFVTDMPVRYALIRDQKERKAEFHDLSIHGALLHDPENLFKDQDQMLLYVPTRPYLPPTSGDYMRLSARVRRTSIAGNTAGISFEYVSEAQLEALTRIVTALAHITEQTLAKAQPQGEDWNLSHQVRTSCNQKTHTEKNHVPQKN